MFTSVETLHKLNMANGYYWNFGRLVYSVSVNTAVKVDLVLLS